MRRKEKEIKDRTEIEAIINTSQVCRVAMSKNDQPYLVPLSFGFDGSAVYVHTAREGKKIEFFEANQRVCVEFESHVQIRPDDKQACKWSVAYESVIGDGTLQELTEPRDIQYGLNQIMRHYSGKDWDIDPRAAGKTRVWKIVLVSLSGKRSV